MIVYWHPNNAQTNYNYLTLFKSFFMAHSNLPRQVAVCHKETFEERQVIVICLCIVRMPINNHLRSILT